MYTVDGNKNECSGGKTLANQTVFKRIHIKSEDMKFMIKLQIEMNKVKYRDAKVVWFVYMCTFFRNQSCEAINSHPKAIKKYYG